MKMQFKRVLALFLCAVMVFGILPTFSKTVAAAETQAEQVNDAPASIVTDAKFNADFDAPADESATGIPGWYFYGGAKNYSHVNLVNRGEDGSCLEWTIAPEAEYAYGVTGLYSEAIPVSDYQGQGIYFNLDIMGTRSDSNPFMVYIRFYKDATSTSINGAYASSGVNYVDGQPDGVQSALNLVDYITNEWKTVGGSSYAYDNSSIAVVPSDAQYCRVFLYRSARNVGTLYIDNVVINASPCVRWIPEEEDSAAARYAWTHDYTNKTASAYLYKADCESSLYFKKCDNCDYARLNMSASNYVEAGIPGHSNLVFVPGKAPTTTADGNVAYWECKDCGGLVADANGKVGTTTIASKISVILPRLTTAAGNQIAFNNSFDYGLEGWTSWHGEAANASTTTVDGRTVLTYAAKNTSVHSQLVDITGWTKVTGSMEFKAVTGNAQLYIRFFDENGAEISRVQKTKAGTAQWDTLSLTVDSIPAGAKYAAVGPFRYQADVEIYYDNVQLLNPNPPCNSVGTDFEVSNISALTNQAWLSGTGYELVTEGDDTVLKLDANNTTGLSQFRTPYIDIVGKNSVTVTFDIKCGAACGFALYTNGSRNVMWKVESTNNEWKTITHTFKVDVEGGTDITKIPYGATQVRFAIYHTISGTGQSTDVLYFDDLNLDAYCDHSMVQMVMPTDNQITVNNSFDDGLKGWTKWLSDKDGASVTTYDGRTVLTYTAANRPVHSQMVDITGWTKVTAKMDYYAVEGSNYQMYILFFDENGVEIKRQAQSSDNVTNAWTTATFTINSIPEGAKYAAVSPFKYNAAHEVYYDNIQLYNPNADDASLDTTAIEKYLVTSATCTTAATYYKYCVECGEAGAETFTLGEVPGHDWNEATCTEAKSCARCGITEGEPTDHTIKTLEAKAPNCESTGITEGEICIDCFTVTKTQEATGTATGHNMADATCTAPKTCTNCGMTEGNALGHAWAEADCDTAKTCTVCGATEGEALGHSYDAVVTDPTCTAGGYTTYTCSVCGDSYTDDEVEATGHSYEAVVTDPTCTAGGYTTYTCSVCGDSYTADEVEATGHSYEAVVTDPTCTAGGYTTYTCSVCGDSYTADEVEATGHNYVGEITQAPTLNAEGVETFTCTGCGDSYTKPVAKLEGAVAEIDGFKYATLAEAIAAAEAGDTITLLVDASITVDTTLAAGVTYEIPAGKVLTVAEGVTVTAEAGATLNCAGTIVVYGKADISKLIYGTTFGAKGGKLTVKSTGTVVMLNTWEGIWTPVNDAQLGAMLTACEDGAYIVVGTQEWQLTSGTWKHVNHTYNAVVTDPTCTAGGYTTYTCSVCGDTYTDDAVDALGHTEVIDEAVAPNCTETGLTEGKHCSACGEVLVAQEEVSALGHSYDAVVTDPTCTAAGYTTYTCSACGDSYTDDAVDALGHTEVIDEAVAPNCTETGLTEGKHCSACGEVLVAQEEVSALGHSYDAVVTDPTCTAAGYTTYTCSACGDSYTDDATEATGHAWGEGVVTIEPTTTAAGEMTYTCTACGEIKTEEIPVVETTVDDTLVFRNDGALNLQSFIGAQFSVTSEIAQKYDSVYIEVTHNGITKIVELIANADDTIYFAEYKMAAKQMADEITIKLLAVSGSTTYEGQVVTGWTVKGKLVSMLDAYYDWYDYSDAYSKRCDLAAAMLNYGAEAQNTFNYNVENLATDGLAAEYVALIPTGEVVLEEMPTFNEDGEQASMPNTLYNPAFMLEEVIKVSLTFALGDTDISKYDAKVVIDGVEATYELTQYVRDGITYEGYAYIVIDSIAAADLRKDFSVTIYEGENKVSTTYTFSMENMASKMMEDRTEIITAMMHYADAANALFR